MYEDTKKRTPHIHVYNSHLISFGSNSVFYYNTDVGLYCLFHFQHFCHWFLCLISRFPLNLWYWLLYLCVCFCYVQWTALNRILIYIRINLYFIVLYLIVYTHFTHHAPRTLFIQFGSNHRGNSNCRGVQGTDGNGNS